MHLSGSDERLRALSSWLAEQTPFGFDVASLAPASSDASFRRYFRLSSATHGTLVLMDAPPDKEDCKPFIQVAAALDGAGVSTPKVLAADLDLGFLILTDLGSTTYLEAVTQDTARSGPLMNDALASLLRLQVGVDGRSLPAYDAALLLREMQLFIDWYLIALCGLTLTPAESDSLSKLFNALVQNALAQVQVAVHRDYHSRNLMVIEDDLLHGNPGVLDFQDAVYGAVTYDLVSLLRDAYISWPEETVLDWSVRYWESLRRATIPVPTDFAEFWTSFELMGLQRHLKVLGIFSRLSLRDQKHGYLKDLPLVLTYVHAVAARYRVAAPLKRLLERATRQDVVTGYTF